MKIELMESGLDDVFRKTVKVLEMALNAKSKRKKNEHICTAIGSLGAAYMLTIVRDDEEKESEND